MSTNKREEFLRYFPIILTDMTEILQDYGMPQVAIDWYLESIKYNTPDGKLNRGLSVIDTYFILTGDKSGGLDDDVKKEQYKKLALLGWCIELLQAYFLVADDIMDHSITRRGKPCWYKKVGDISINDAFMLEATIYSILKKYFRNEKYYVDLLELFHEVTLQTELGQLLDLITAPEDEVNLDNFSMSKHSFIVRFKTAYYSFYLPVVLAMYVAGITDLKDLEQARNVLIPLGEYFQIQDDYLDCYGTEKQIGKIGTDIKDNKCSWLINKALELATDADKAILKSNYGQKDDECEFEVKEVFNKLQLDKEYMNYENRIVKQIRGHIDQVDESRGFKKQVLTEFLNKIYKRDK